MMNRSYKVVPSKEFSVQWLDYNTNIKKAAQRGKTVQKGGFIIPNFNYNRS